MKRHLIILLLMLAASLKTMAQENDLPLSAFVKDESGKYKKTDWVSSQNRCKQFYDKHNIPLLFFVTADPEMNPNNDNFEKLGKYLDTKYDEWNYIPEDGKQPYGMIAFAMFVGPKGGVASSWSGYGDIYSNYVQKQTDLINKTLRTWTAQDIPEKIADMVECLYESKPLLRYGASIDMAIDKAIEEEKSVIDLSGLMGYSETLILDSLCVNIKNKTNRELYLATIMAPSFNKRNLEDLARQIGERMPSVIPEMLLINEYNCDFATYLAPAADTDGSRTLSVSDYDDLKKILTDNSQTEFLNGKNIKEFAMGYVRKTLTTVDKLHSFAEDGLIAGICCYLPISFVLFSVISNIIMAMDKKKEKPQGAKQYIRKTNKKDTE